MLIVYLPTSSILVSMLVHCLFLVTQMHAGMFVIQGQLRGCPSHSASECETTTYVSTIDVVSSVEVAVLVVVWAAFSLGL